MDNQNSDDPVVVAARLRHLKTELQKAVPAAQLPGSKSQYNRIPDHKRAGYARLAFLMISLGVLEHTGIDKAGVKDL